MGDRSEEEELARTLAGLARLGLEDVGARSLGRGLTDLLAAFRTLESADVDGIEPLFAPAGGPVAGLRDDCPAPGLERSALLERAPATHPPVSRPVALRDGAASAARGADSGAGGAPRFFRVPSALPGRPPRAGSAGDRTP